MDDPRLDRSQLPPPSRKPRQERGHLRAKSAARKQGQHQVERGGGRVVVDAVHERIPVERSPHRVQQVDRVEERDGKGRMDRVAGQVAQPAGRQIRKLELGREPEHGPAGEGRRHRLLEDAGRAEQRAVDARVGGEQRDMDLGPGVPAGVVQRYAVVRTVARLDVRHPLVPAAQEFGFHRLGRLRRDQDVDVAHRPQVRRRVMLVADRYSLEQRRAGAQGSADVDDLGRDLDAVGMPDLGRQVGAAKRLAAAVRHLDEPFAQGEVEQRCESRILYVPDLPFVGRQHRRSRECVHNACVLLPHSKGQQITEERRRQSALRGSSRCIFSGRACSHGTRGRNTMKNCSFQLCQRHEMVDGDEDGGLRPSRS